jgi:hypothetical protein
MPEQTPNTKLHQYTNQRKQQTKQKNPLKMATNYRISQEIKFLYIKKTQLNEQLYQLHQECAKKWRRAWCIIQEQKDQHLTREMEKHYDNLNHKIDQLTNKQQRRNEANSRSHPHQFYNRVTNLTTINFTPEETALLNKGLQHSSEQPINRY